MPMSDTPKKMLFITMKLSAAELEKASSVAFIMSEPSWRSKEGMTYNALLLDDVDGGVDVVLSHQGNAQERVHDACTVSSTTYLADRPRSLLV